MAITPNIFEFAPSELSQDAFLCYLFSFGKSNYSQTQEYKLAHLFLEKLGIDEDVKDIKHQENHVDVLLITPSYVIILEDKTFSKEHSEQLKRYKENCENKYADKKIKLLYFKTGYTDIQEKDKFDKEVCIFDIEKIMALIKTYTGNDVIIKMWIENVGKIHEEITSANKGIQNIEDFGTYYNLPNMLQKDVYLDKLTKKLKANFEYAHWYRAGQGRTPHICFSDIYIPCPERCKIHFGVYIMFRKEAQIVVKQHFYIVQNDHRLRLREYKQYPQELTFLQEYKRKFQQSITKNGWEKKNENKDKLIILEKKIDNMASCTEDIKYICDKLSELKNAYS